MMKFELIYCIVNDAHKTPTRKQFTKYSGHSTHSIYWGLRCMFRHCYLNLQQKNTNKFPRLLHYAQFDGIGSERYRLIMFVR